MKTENHYSIYRLVTFVCLFIITVIGKSYAQAPSLMWAYNFGSANHHEVGYSVIVDNGGNTITTGMFWGTMDCDPGPGTFNLTSADVGVFVIKLNSSGNFVWAKAIVGNNTVEPLAMATDAFGELFITGRFGGTIDFDPGVGVANLTAAGSFDVFVVKLNSSGNFMWAKPLGGTDLDWPYGIAVDGNTNVVVTGEFYGTADFDPGAGVYNLTSSGFNDAFIVKLDAGGNLAWAIKIGSSSNDVGYTVAMNATGDVYATGGFWNTSDFDPGIGTFTMTSVDLYDMYILKLNASGNFVWAKKIGGVGYELSYSQALDNSSNIYITGLFNGPSDFDPGAGTFTLTSSGGWDAFVAKLDASGNFVWAKKMGSTAEDYGQSLCIDVNGNVYTTGRFNNTVDFDPGAGTFNLTSAGARDIYISKLDASGNFVWTLQIGSTLEEFSNCIAINDAGQIAVTGTFIGPTDFNPGSGVLTLTPNGGNDMFLVKLIECTMSGQVFAGGPTTFCTGGSVNMSVVTPSNPTFQWRLNGTNIPGATISSYNATASGNYDCVITNACTSMILNSISVTVVPGVPPASITAAGPTVICTGNTVTMNANTGTGISYQWQNNTVNIAGATSASYGATASGSYRCQETNVCGSAFSNTIGVTVETGPSATITASGPTTFCTGSTVTLNAATGAGLIYQWAQNGTSIPGETNSSYVAAASGNYTCTVTNSCGNVTSNTIGVVVNSTPTASISAGGSTTFCSGGSVVLNANTGTGISYQWRLNGGNISGATTSSYTAASAGSYTCFESNSCGNSLSNEITVTVNTVPSATISAMGPVAFCSGGFVILDATTNTGTSFQWKLNTVNIAGATFSSYTAATTGNYTCSISNSCGSTLSNNITVTVNTLPAAPASITGQVSGVCSSSKTYSISAVAGATNYSWFAPVGSSITSGQGTTSVVIAFTNTFGSGDVSVRAGNSCGNGGLTQLNVTGTPAQPGSITGSVSVCHNQNNVNYSIVALTGATSYTWTVPSGASIKSGQGTRQIKVRFGNSAGNVTVKANNACGSGPIRSLAVAMPCRDAEEMDLSDISIESVFPNPAHDQVQISFTKSIASETRLVLSDLTGRIVKQQTVFTPEGANMITLDVLDLSKGLYLLSVASNSDHHVIRLMIE